MLGVPDITSIAGADNAKLRLTLTLCVITITGLIFQLLWKILYSPFAKIPGPKLAKVTSIPMLRAQSKFQRMYWVHSLFQTYGSIVQIAPNYVVTNETEGIRKIYKNLKVLKGPFYDTFSIIDGARPCLALKNLRKANQRRKSYLPAFSRQHLMAFAPRIYEHLREFTEKLDELEARGEPLDSLRYWRYLTLDVVVDLTYNGKLNMIKNPGENARIVEITADQTKWFILNIYFPLISKISDTFLPKTLLKWKEAALYGEKFPKDAFQNWKEEKNSGGLASRSLDVIETLSKFGEDGLDEKLTDSEIVATISEIMVAGSDTTATITSCVCFELAKNPQMQERLYQELRQIMPEGRTTAFSPKMFIDLENNAYLNAVCKEGLRKYASLPALLERVVPPEGMEINGKYLPPGTIIAMQAYSQHRKEDVYPDSETFKPERWLDETPAMKENFLAFSTGNRSCIGLNLANLQLRLYLGIILHEFQLSLHPNTTDSSMQMLESYIITPKEDCLVFFKRRNNN